MPIRLQAWGIVSPWPWSVSCSLSLATTCSTEYRLAAAISLHLSSHVFRDSQRKWTSFRGAAHSNIPTDGRNDLDGGEREARRQEPRTRRAAARPGGCERGIVRKRSGSATSPTDIGPLSSASEQYSG